MPLVILDLQLADTFLPSTPPKIAVSPADTARNLHVVLVQWAGSKSSHSGRAHKAPGVKEMLADAFTRRTLLVDDDLLLLTAGRLG